MHSTTKKSIALIAIAAPMLALLFLGTAFLVGARDTATQSWFLVAKTSEQPTDGTSILKTVSAKRFDAWMRLPDDADHEFVDVGSGDSGGAVVFAEGGGGAIGGVSWGVAVGGRNCGVGGAATSCITGNEERGLKEFDFQMTRTFRP